MAEEGEQVLLEKAQAQFGLDLSDAKLIYTGEGPINIIRSLQSIDREAEIYNIGYAGSANFDLGTWVEVTEVRLNHPNVTYPEPTLKLNGESLKLKRHASGDLLHQLRFCAGFRLQRLCLRYGVGFYCRVGFYPSP